MPYDCKALWIRLMAVLQEHKNTLVSHNNVTNLSNINLDFHSLCAVVPVATIWRQLFDCYNNNKYHNKIEVDISELSRSRISWWKIHTSFLRVGYVIVEIKQPPPDCCN